MRCYTTLWNCLFKNRSDLKLCEENLPCKTQQLKTSSGKYLPSDVSIISVHWWKDIYSSCTEKPTEWLTECICSNQEQRRRHKMPAHKINVQYWRHQSAITSGWQYTSLILVDHEVKINETYYRNVMQLQQFVLAIHQISSKFSVFQQDSALMHKALRQSVFSENIRYMLSSVRLSVTLVRPTQAVQIFGNISTSLGTLAIRWHPLKISRRSSQGNPSAGELNTRGVAKYSDFGPVEGHISETVQER